MVLAHRKCRQHKFSRAETEEIKILQIKGEGALQEGAQNEGFVQGLQGTEQRPSQSFFFSRFKQRTAASRYDRYTRYVVMRGHITPSPHGGTHLTGEEEEEEAKACADNG